MIPERWERVAELYRAALERPEDGREAYLSQACGADEELRREVESLLAQEDNSFLEKPVLEVAARQLAQGQAESRQRSSDGATGLTGRTISHYQIGQRIGVGGMGEVYRALDTRLGREVALKFLPEALAKERDRLARFKREAQMLASLNHPNIAAIYGLEESPMVGAAPGVATATLALVMELVEGRTLASRIESGAIPLEEALPIAKQIAEALEAAHEKGIIHRDLKPANIKVTPEGTVKVLDFGLAKALDPEDSANNPNLSNSPTVSTAATEAGMILGTAGYMSPEQAKGQRVDRRCDIWAFGCVLYEMLAGRKAFAGETMPETLAAVLKSEPDWSALPETTPIAIQRLVRRCLRKDPRRRLRDIGDARVAIEDALNGEADAEADVRPAPAAPAKSPLRKWLAPLAVTVVLVALAGTGAWLLGRKASGDSPAFQPLTFDRGLIYSARFAPEGNSIYYSAAWSGQPIQLYATQPNRPESRPLGLKNSALLAVSSAELAITVGCEDLFIGDCEGTLATVPASGGTPREIATGVVSADWTADRRAMAVIRAAGGKFRVEFPLGEVIYESGSWLNFLRVSPRGDAVAFAAFSSNAGDEGRVVILGRDGRRIARSSREFTSIEGLAWAPAGNEVWFAGTRNLGWADAIHSLSRTGKERIVLRFPGMVRLHDVSRDGRVLFSKDVWRTEIQFRTAKDAEQRDLSWLDSPILTDLAPDGERLAFDEWGLTTGPHPVAYVRNTEGSPPVELGEGFAPALSPDQKWVLVALFDPPRLALVPTGAGEARDLSAQGFKQFLSLGWMPGGNAIYFAGNNGQNWRVYVQDLAGGAPRAITPPILVKAEYYEANLAAPNGQVLFARDETGRGWLFPLKGGNPQAVRGLSAEDIWVNWAADGRSAYVYQDRGSYGLMFRVDLTTGSRRLVAKLAPNDPAGLTSIAPVRITPDGTSWAYSDNRALSDLYLGEGLK